MQSEHDALAANLCGSARKSRTRKAEVKPTAPTADIQTGHIPPEALDTLKDLARMIGRQLARESKP